MSANFLQDLAYRHLTRTMNTLAGGLTQNLCRCGSFMGVNQLTWRHLAFAHLILGSRDTSEISQEDSMFQAVRRQWCPLMLCCYGM